jgi:phytoene synthase
LRNFVALAARGRCAVPDALLAAAGLTAEAALADPAAAMARFGPGVRQAGLALMGGRRRWRRRVLAAALPGVLARRDLRRDAPVAARGAGDRLAVMGAVVAGRV